MVVDSSPMRSKSRVIFSTAVIKRNWPANGALVNKMITAASKAFSNSSNGSSPAVTLRASSSSRSTKARTARTTRLSAMLAMRSNWSLSRVISASNGVTKRYWAG
jgi:hypothetical protein